jgi:hypothetical protein
MCATVATLGAMADLVTLAVFERVEALLATRQLDHGFLDLDGLYTALRVECGAAMARIVASGRCAPSSKPGLRAVFEHECSVAAMRAVHAACVVEV